MREDLEWPVRNRGVDRRGADVLSGFSGQPMGADPDSEFFRQYIDARSGTAEGERYSGPLREEGTFDDEVELTGGVTIVGTNDPPGVTNLRTVDHIYMHELGHVLGAVHPNNQDSPSSSEEFGIEPRTGGAMCKDSCIDPLNDGFGVDDLVDPPEESILTGEFYAEPNKNRILNLDYDYKDGTPDTKEDEPPQGSINRARNLTSVATATSTDPPSGNTP
jgi:hypothetical protein